MFPFHPQTAGNKDASRHNDTKTKDMKAKKYLYQTAGKAAALAACLLLFSCSGDDLADYGSANGGKHSDNICFSISAADKAMAKGASLADSSKAAGEYTAARFVMRSPDTDDTLCVQTVISDGINVTSFEGGTAATRGVPVTSLETYGSFHVQAHCTDNGTPVSQFYMDDNATNSDGTVWSTSQVRYWPGENRTLQFFAWAPADAAFTATPGSPESTTFKYTVPDNATDQKDIVVATTDRFNGNHKQQVPLTFKHILTAVKFEFGSQMQPGTIKSVALKGVIKGGTYTAFPTGSTGEGTWTLNDATADYTQELNKTTTGAETNGTPVTTKDGTFMMLPQTLPDGAEVEVVFQDGTSGQERTMSASIAGTQWPQGKTVTYKLSITPEYKFEITEENPVIDAHYVIFQTTLKVSGVAPNQSWTITAPIGINNGEDVTIQLQSSMNQLAKRGYWIDRRISANGADRGSARGTNTLSGTGSGEFPIAVYVPENAGESNRTVSLTATVGNVGTAAATIDLTQLCPSWNNGIGCERFEEYDEGFSDGYPWGFLWDENFSITYDMPDLGNIWDAFENVLINFYLTFLDNRDYVDVDRAMLILVRSVTINFGEIPQIDVADDDQNGRQNTLELYNFEGINDASALMAALEQIGATPDIDLPSNPTEFAARAAVMRNKFQAQEDPDGETDPSTGETIIRAVLRDEDCVWYLPSRNEAPNMIDEQYSLSGEYWTSTAIHDNQNAYMYSVGSQPVSERRDISHKVRAVRSK